MAKKRNLFDYVIVFTLPHRMKYEYAVEASSATEAIAMAKVMAASDGVLVFECDIEVKR